jgi:hypothetical protein
VNIHIQYETQLLEGKVSVQSTIALPNGKHRCGFLVSEKNKRMRRSLERISSMIQRLHLRRLAEFRVLDAGVEVNGETVYSVVDGMGAFEQTALKILARQGIANPEPGEWYSQQALLNALGVIEDKLGTDAVYNIGFKIPDNALFPPGIESLDKALNSLNDVFHSNHRNGEIGDYTLSFVGESSFEIVCRNSYPCEFDRGLLAALCSRYKPKGSDANATVMHDDSKPCRKKGGSSCTYQIAW